MGDFQITIVNKTASPGSPGRPVTVMIFQTVTNVKSETDSYFSAWVVDAVSNPGILGPISLPNEVQFYVIEHTPGPQQSGPTQVKVGQEIKVLQPNKQSPPKAIVIGTPQPNVDHIKVINNGGNAQPLEMALFKNDRKVVSFKGVIPNEFVYFSIKPAIYICAVEGIRQGEDFNTSIFFDNSLSFEATYPTKFDLLRDKLNMNIQITQKPSKELVFTEVDFEAVNHVHQQRQ